MRRTTNGILSEAPYATGGDVLQSIEGFVTEIDGERFIVTHTTRLRSGHPVVRAYPQHFRPVQPNDRGVAQGRVA